MSFPPVKLYPAQELQHAHALFWSSTPEGRFVNVNPALLRSLGYSVEEMNELHLWDILVPEMTQIASQEQLIACSSSGELLQLVLNTKSGNLLNTEGSVAASYDDSGQLHLLHGIFHVVNSRSITEQALENALQQEKELNDLKSRFITVVSHEFRTPLATIMATTNTLRSYFDRISLEERNRRLDKIQTQVRHMTHMLSMILNLGSTETILFHPTQLDPAQFCQGVIDEMIQKHQLPQPLLFQVEGSFPTAWDSLLMREMLTNLLSNASRYSGFDQPIELSLKLEAQHTTLTIRDYGLGIPQQEQPHIFLPFFRASNVDTITGTGLGLVLVKRAVEVHGGSITFTSQISAGSTFTVTLPSIHASGQPTLPIENSFYP